MVILELMKLYRIAWTKATTSLQNAKWKKKRKKREEDSRACSSSEFGVDEKIINTEEEKRTKLLTDKEKTISYGGFFECLVLMIQTATHISIIQIKFIKLIKLIGIVLVGLTLFL